MPRVDVDVACSAIRLHLRGSRILAFFKRALNLRDMV